MVPQANAPQADVGAEALTQDAGVADVAMLYDTDMHDSYSSELSPQDHSETSESDIDADTLGDIILIWADVLDDDTGESSDGTDAGCEAGGCPPISPCAIGTCDITTGNCSYAPANDGAACDDLSPCTLSDACNEGMCVGSPMPCGATETCLEGTCAAIPVAPTGMVFVPAGVFKMGCVADDQTCQTSPPLKETPRHAVALSAFFMDQNEVTAGKYNQCVSAGKCLAIPWWTCGGGPPSLFPELGDYPMSCVSQPEAVMFCKWAGKTLPTEAQWEYAARGGLDGALYPWGNEITCDHVAAWYVYGAACPAPPGWVKDDPAVPITSQFYLGGSHPLGTNGYGLNDMAGGVREWVADVGMWLPYTLQSELDPLHITDGNPTTARVRGGGSTGGADFRASDRGFNVPNEGSWPTYWGTGMRCVKSLK